MHHNWDGSLKNDITIFKQKHILRWIDGARYKERKDNQELRRGRGIERQPGAAARARNRRTTRSCGEGEEEKDNQELRRGRGIEGQPGAAARARHRKTTRSCGEGEE